jgi:hypothetical protein
MAASASVVDITTPLEVRLVKPGDVTYGMTYFDYNVSVTLDLVLKSDNANGQVIVVSC